ncbi:MAG TPA: hypothetical protein PLP88_08900 [Bacteroidales bacterium]|nr:hypothetical protein [Bacteroidales bacterium]
MKKFRFPFFLFILLGFLLSGCLTCEKKEYIFELTGPESGKLTIRFVNIFSNSLDSAGEVKTDYAELVDMWLEGEKIERDYPLATKFRKRLYEANGQLCGEVSIEFSSLKAVRLYKYDAQSPYMLNTTTMPDDGETFLSSNGEFGGDHMPVIFWRPDNSTMRLVTSIAKPDSTTVSLLDTWKANTKKR